MPKTLLLADDSITIQKVVGITFAAEDYQITAVDNGEDAIAKAREMKPNIILADVVMPRKNGYEVCEAIKADLELQHIPVLLLAGTFEAFDESRARAARADGHIAKPFESGALIAKVKELVEGVKPQPAAPARPLAPQPAPAPVPAARAIPAAAARPAPAPGAPRPDMPFGARPGSRPTVPGAPPGGFRPGMPGAMPPPGFRPATPGAPPAGFRPGVPGAMPPRARPPGPMPGSGMRPPGPGMAPRPGMAFPGAPPAGVRPTMPGVRPPAAGTVPPGARAPMQPAAPAARPAAPAAPLGTRAPAAPERRPRESFGFDVGSGRGAQRPGQVEADFGDLGLGEKAAAPPGAPPAAVRGGVPKEIALEGAAAGMPPPIDLGLEEPGEVEPAPVHAFAPPPAATGHRPEGAPAGDAGEAVLREALSKASLEVIERVVWEVVPQLAETIIRENLERLAKERQGA